MSTNPYAPAPEPPAPIAEIVFSDCSFGPAIPVKFCVHCWELLPTWEQSEGECPKCGRHFMVEDRQTWTERRVFLWWKFWAPGFCMAVASGALTFAFALEYMPTEAAAILALPVSVGAVIAYGAPPRVLGVVWFLATGAICGFTTLYTLNCAGMVFGMLIGLLLFLPLSAGAVFGAVLAGGLRNSTWDQRWFFPRR